MVILGLANKNLFNIKCYNRNNPWKGTAGYDRAGHVIFYHEIFSIRAACRDVAAKYLNGRKTLREIMGRYSPASDTLGSIKGQAQNDPITAAQFIGKHMGDIGIDDDLRLFDDDGRPLNNDKLCRFLEALYRQECGWKPPAISRYLLLAGIEDYVKDFVK